MKAWISIVLISVFSVVCFGSCQSTQAPPKDSSTEIVLQDGGMPNETRSSGNDTNTVAATTTPDSAQANEQHSTQKSSSNEEKNNTFSTPSTMQEWTSPDRVTDAKGELKSISYKTEKGRIFRRAMFDLLKDGSIVPFHVIMEGNRTYLLFDEGEDISDDYFETALKTFDRIDSRSVTILSDPQLEQVIAYPVHDYYVLGGRPFVKGTVKLEGDENVEDDYEDSNTKKTYQL